jgi:hypothetical protein
MTFSHYKGWLRVMLVGYCGVTICGVVILLVDSVTRNKRVRHALSSVNYNFPYPGKVSEIEFNFVEHKDKKDIYSFTRLFPADTNESTKSSNIVEFNGNQIVVFEDEYQVIVIDSPVKQ